MSGRIGRPIIGLVAAVAILLFAAWFDWHVLFSIERQQATTFDIRPFAWAAPFGYLVAAAGVLALAVLAWWSRSLLVAVVYVLVGAFFAFLYTLEWIFSATHNSAPPIFPHPIADFISNVAINWLGLDFAPTHAVSVIGAGMFLAGLGALGRAIRQRAQSHPA
jgi:hypothetical protein